MGTAVQVIVAENDHSFTTNESALERILLDCRVRDSKVIVLSIAGAFRKGKSFLLNFFLRYLYAEGSKNWIGDPNAPLKGFDWQGGAERNTSGILMWSDPFEVALPSGEKACVLLMDTQGVFDSQSTVKDCATVFALSTMLSSVQVFNLMSNIQENDLQHLQFFTEYGRLALEQSNSKPFQNLYFLVRDWSWPSDFEYGWKGGEKLLAKRLEIKTDQHQELQQLRRQLENSFAKIGCCLMPYPGEKVATDRHFEGRLSEIKDDFKLQVEEFVSCLLSREHLVVKEINGRKITGKELFEYLKAYVKIYQGNELPQPRSVFEATAEANNLAAVREAMDLYTEDMERVCGGNQPHVKSKTLKQEHDRSRQKAIEHFQSIRKMGGEEKSRGFQEQLEQRIDMSYAYYDRINAAKNFFANFQFMSKKEIVAAVGLSALVAYLRIKRNIPI